MATPLSSCSCPKHSALLAAFLQCECHCFLLWIGIFLCELLKEWPLEPTCNRALLHNDAKTRTEPAAIGTCCAHPDASLLQPRSQDDCVHFTPLPIQVTNHGTGRPTEVAHDTKVQIRLRPRITNEKRNKSQRIRFSYALAASWLRFGCVLATLWLRFSCTLADELYAPAP